MKLHLLDRSSISNSSFTTKVNEYTYFLKIWHYHPELELVVILKSEGTCFVGDSIEKFEVGDVVLIGKNLPHMWLNDENYFDQDKDEAAKAIAIHFKQNYLGAAFFETPEMIHLLEFIKPSLANFLTSLCFANLSRIIKNEMVLRKPFISNIS